jgi:hypothetical protein
MRKEGGSKVNVQSAGPTKPVLLVVEDDPKDLERIARELRT